MSLAAHSYRKLNNNDCAVVLRVGVHHIDTGYRLARAAQSVANFNFHSSSKTPIIGGKNQKMQPWGLQIEKFISYGRGGFWHL